MTKVCINITDIRSENEQYLISLGIGWVGKQEVNGKIVYFVAKYVPEVNFDEVDLVDEVPFVTLDSLRRLDNITIFAQTMTGFSDWRFAQQALHQGRIKKKVNVCDIETNKVYTLTIVEDVEANNVAEPIVLETFVREFVG